MKIPTCLLLTLSFTAVAFADIHEPPAADHGPTRKFSRGIANIAFGATEIPNTIGRLNVREGNNAAASYGVVKGVLRTVDRVKYGVYDVVTFPFPTYKGKYTPPYKSDLVWKHSGYSEFPEELGTETKYTYGRNND